MLSFGMVSNSLNRYEEKSEGTLTTQSLDSGNGRAQ